QRGVTGWLPRAAACADFDGDGRVDVATMDFANGTLRVLRNVAGAGPPAAEPYPCDGPRFVPPSTPVQAIALDLDGDGRADLATANEGEATHAPSVTILFNPPGAAWAAIPEAVDVEAPAPDPATVAAGGVPEPGPGRLDLESAGGAVMLAAADLNGDG